MVRKRSRPSRKYVSSDDNFTESDYSLDGSPEEPAPKKYSLRQRKKTSAFIEDYYEDPEDAPSPRGDDDEDFELKEEDAEAESSDASSRDSRDVGEGRPVQSHSIPIDPSGEVPDDPDELIDFEDVIRADIVVNKNRIDYDNLISKSEIDVDSLQRTATDIQIDGGLLEPETEVTEQYTDFNDDDDDYVPGDFLSNVAFDCVQTEMQENNENGKDDVVIKQHLSPQQPDSTFEDNHSNISDDSPPTPPVSQESVIKVNPLQVNGSSFHIENPEIHFELKQESEDDDDDVVLIEDKNCEVIVLDD